jgi:hypothetical protein
MRDGRVHTNMHMNKGHFISELLAGAARLVIN